MALYMINERNIFSHIFFGYAETRLMQNTWVHRLVLSFINTKITTINLPLQLQLQKKRNIFSYIFFVYGEAKLHHTNIINPWSETWKGSKLKFGTMDEFFLPILCSYLQLLFAALHTLKAVLHKLKRYILYNLIAVLHNREACIAY